MIGSLKGRIAEISVDHVLLDVAGVGYEVAVSQNTREDLFLGQEAQVWIYTHVREDQFTLFGFSQKAEKSLFLELIKVNGVGPKMALSILSGARVDQIQKLIESEDIKGLTALPKVGKKTAEQLILALKGKLATAPVSSQQSLIPHPQIASALVNLGFKNSEVESVVKGLPSDVSFDEGLRQGLAALSSL